MINYLNSKYIYNIESLNSLIRETVFSSSHKGKNLKSTMDCHEVWTYVYIQELNWWYYSGGASIELADEKATIAANWARIGCQLAMMY